MIATSSRKLIDVCSDWSKVASRKQIDVCSDWSEVASALLGPIEGYKA